LNKRIIIVFLVAEALHKKKCEQFFGHLKNYVCMASYLSSNNYEKSLPLKIIIIILKKLIL